MNPVRQKLDDLIKERGLNMSALSKAVGRNGTYIQQFIKYGTPGTLPEVVRHRLAKELQLSERDLRNGRIVDSFDPDAPDTQIDPDAAADGSDFPPDAIKELASKAGMGAGQTIATTYVRDGQEIVQRDAVRDDYWRIPPDFVQSLLHARTIDLLVVECDGDSMVPTLMPKERVIVNTAHRKISPDGLYAMRNQYEDVVVKRLELFGTAPPRVRIISDNPKHEPQERGLDEIEVVGKVVLGLKLF